MRKLKLQMHLSADGYVAGPNGEEDWTVRGSDERLWQIVNSLPDTSDTLLLGRKMAPVFLSHFEATPPDSPRYEFAQKLVNIPKVIFTKTLTEPIGRNTTLATGDLDTEIARLKALPGKDILVYGGAGLVSSLLAGGHIDEFIFFVSPVMIGSGMRIFDQAPQRQKLKLLTAGAHKGDVVLLHYTLQKD